MNNQDKHFWSQFPEEELRDPGTRQVLAALGSLYQSDVNDQQSVQRAWERICLDIEHEKQRKLFTRSNTSGRLSRNLLRIRAGDKSHVQKIRFNTLLAATVALFMIASMIAVTTYFQSMKTTATGAPLPATGTRPPATGTLPPGTEVYSPVPLGTSLGQLHLGITLEELMKRYSNIGKNSSPKASDTYLCFSCGFRIVGPEGATQLTVWGPFHGTTDEGLGLNMSFKQFRTLYQFYQLKAESKSFNFQIEPGIIIHYDFRAIVKDANGIYLIVLFRQQKVVTIMLQHGPGYSGN